MAEGTITHDGGSDISPTDILLGIVQSSHPSDELKQNKPSSLVPSRALTQVDIQIVPWINS